MNLYYPKQCSKCKIYKDRSLFYQNKNNPDGLKYHCKECCVKSNKRYKSKRSSKDKRNKTDRENRANNPILRMVRARRTRRRFVLKDINSKSLKDLGCPLEQWKSYLEKQFHSGMAWENYRKCLAS